MSRATRRIRSRTGIRESRLLPQVTGLWLLGVWFLLWGRISPGVTASGVVVITLVVLLFPLEPLPLDGRLRVVPALRHGVHFLWDLIRASVEVAWLAVRPGVEPTAAVIGVPLRTQSDLLLTLTAESVALIPGSLVVEIDRTETTLYLHLLGVRNEADLDRERRRVRALEARLIRAFGSEADRAVLAGRVEETR